MPDVVKIKEPKNENQDIKPDVHPAQNYQGEEQQQWNCWLEILVQVWLVGGTPVKFSSFVTYKLGL